MRMSTATLIVTKLEAIPSCTMKMTNSMYPCYTFSLFISINSNDPVREMLNIEIRTHLRFLTFPFEDLIREPDIFERKIPPRRQPKK